MESLYRCDVETAVAASVPVIVSPLSHCYLDVPYAEPSADPRQAERQVGQRGLFTQDHPGTNGLSELLDRIEEGAVQDGRLHRVCDSGAASGAEDRLTQKSLHSITPASQSLRGLLTD